MSVLSCAPEAARLYAVHVGLGASIGTLVVTKNPLAIAAIALAAEKWISDAQALVECYKKHSEDDKAAKLQSQIGELQNILTELDKLKAA